MHSKFLIPLLFLFPSVSFADVVAECKAAAKNSVDQCTKWANTNQDNQNSAADSTAAACRANPDVPVCANNLSTLGTNNLATNQATRDACDKQYDKCKETCDPSKGKDANETKFLSQQRDDCKSKIDDVKKQIAKGDPDNGKAKDGGTKTASSSGSDKSGNNQSPMSVPPMAAPQQPQSNKSSDTTPTQTADNSQSQQAPAAAQPAQQSSQQSDKGSASYKTASKNTDNPCGTLNSSEISGCNGATSASTQVASAVAPFNSNSYSSGGGGGGGSGGGMSIASAPIGANTKLGESEKDGKSTGLKAASINIGTDGGGGGGGAGGSGGHDFDMDFGIQPASTARGPASAMNKAKTASIDVAAPGVAVVKTSVVRIVSDVYSDRCKAGRLMHCGNNK